MIQSTPDTDRAGTGVHRLFQGREVQVAALLVPLSELGMPIGVLRGFAGIIRTALLTSGLRSAPGELGEMARRHADVSDVLERAARGQGRNYLLLAQAPAGPWLHVTTDSAGAVCIDPDHDFAGASLAKTTAIIVLDLTKILGSLLT